VVASIAYRAMALTPVKPAAKKITIICIKGKLTKKISNVSPKCPAGYKKKSSAS
jgi:hypothetical protein